MKIQLVEPSCFMRTERRTDRQTRGHDKANSRLTQFCEST